MALMMKPEPFTNDFNRLVNTLLGPAGDATAQRWMPPMDLVEADDHFVLRADLPGMAEGDVSIEIQDNTLTLPEGVNADAVAASFNRGVLEVRIPKPEQRKPRRVTIQALDEPPATGNGPTATLEGTASER